MIEPITPTPQSPIKTQLGIFRRDNYLVMKYIVAVITFTAMIGIFSVVMSAVSRQRADITNSNYERAADIYSGPLMQASPTINAFSESDDKEVYAVRDISNEQAKNYAQNTALLSTNGNVVINADFIKKGLSYQPTYRTEFQSSYVLKNSLDEASVVTFAFPFPANTSDSEITNATLKVDGKNIDNAKAQFDKYTYFSNIENDDQYAYDYDTSTSTISSVVPGLKWVGEIPAQGSVTVDVTYETVGLSLFRYEGIENPKGAQDFTFNVTINGIRAYDITDGLSVDEKKFGPKQVVLLWNKTNLYSKPVIAVEVGDKINPSRQVSRVYLVMTPLYLVAISILLFLFYRFGKKLSVFDLSLITVLYTIYFPVVHYLSSFTIDPTIEVFSSFDNVGYFSMPLYGAFAITWFIVGGLLMYLSARLSSLNFAIKFMLPCLVLFLGFFPLVLTVPEYSILLTLIGIIALLVIIIQSRLKLAKTSL